MKNPLTSTTRIAFPAIVILALAACGGAPSESEIATAFKKQADRDAADMRKVTGGMLSTVIPEIKDVKKIGCKEDGEKAWRCDVEIKVKQGQDERTVPTAMRVVKTSEGWLIGR